MSRPQWAGMETCVLASAAIVAGERAGLVGQAPLGPRLSLGTVSSAKRLVRLLVASMLVLIASTFVIALAPASALAASGHDIKPSAAEKKHHSGRRHRAGAVMLALGSGFGSREGAARVRVLQRRLARAGCAPGPIDGLYGPRTEQAVIRFQAARGLLVDGIAGPQTLAHLGTQRTSHRITRPRHPGGSHHPAHRPSRR